MIVGMAGAILSVAALPISSLRATPGRSLQALSLLVLHLAACVAYYLYAQSNPADANVYYFDKIHADTATFAFGTVFTGKFTLFLRKTLDGSFLECFIFFQAIGFWGLMLLMRTFQEIHIKLGTAEGPLSTALLFLPSIQFWTSAIGKDAPLFLAVSLCTWSVMELRRRLIPFGFGLLIMILFRAHIALVVVMCLALAAALHPKISFGRKVGLLAVTLFGAYLLIGAVANTINVNVADTSSIAGFFQDRGDVAQRVSGGTTIGDAPVYIRLLTLLFRPFFFDAPNIPGMIASVENVGSLCLFFYLVKNIRGIRFLARRVYFLEYCFVFSIVLIALLTMISYNVGLGLRERVMVFPTLFSLFIAHWAMPRKQPLTSAPRYPGEYLPYARSAPPLTEVR